MWVDAGPRPTGKASTTAKMSPAARPQFQNREGVDMAPANRDASARAVDAFDGAIKLQVDEKRPGSGNVEYDDGSKLFMDLRGNAGGNFIKLSQVTPGQSREHVHLPEECWDKLLELIA